MFYNILNKNRGASPAATESEMGRYFKNVAEAQSLCEALAAPARIEIMRLVLSHRTDSLDALAKTLHLTNGAITQHVKKLCDAGLIRLVEAPGRHGVAKRCVPAVDRIIIEVAADLADAGSEVHEIALGAFTSASVNPYCAIATKDGWIGERDDPRYFTYPERAAAALIYFNSGKIGWTLPAPPAKSKPKSIAVSLELSSKPYGFGQSRSSDIAFFLNDAKLGTASVDGEYVDRRGLFTPPSFDRVCQYDKYKTIKIDGAGTWFDGIKIGDFTVADINTDRLVFSLSTDNGVALFGGGYGDHDCGLRYRVEYAE